jgi:hypothetical protein
LEDYERDIYEAALESGEYTSSLYNLINLAGEDNLQGYGFLPGVHTDEDLGYYWIEDSGNYRLDEMGNLANYFDYAAFGRDIRINEGGEYIGSGYICCQISRLEEYYDGKEVPEEYRVFAYPDRAVKSKPAKEEQSHER